MGDFCAFSQTWLKCNYLETEGTSIVYVWFNLSLLAASDSYNLLFTSEIVSNGGKIEKFWFFKRLRFHWLSLRRRFWIRVLSSFWAYKLTASGLHAFATTPTPNSSFFKTCLYFCDHDGDYDFASLWSHDVDIMITMIIIFCCWEPAKLNWSIPVILFLHNFHLCWLHVTSVE